MRLCVILDPAFARGRAAADVARAAIAGGATMLQVRSKTATTRALFELTREVLDAAAGEGVPVVVNDRADVALAAGAQGAHVGEDDLPVADLRRLLGARGVVGASAATSAAARAAERDGADYLGVGDVFGTRSKPDADPPIGLEGLASVARASRLPVVAIGGVSAANAADAVRAGAAGVAVISAVVSADDVAAAARALREAVDRALASREGALRPPEGGPT